MIVSTDFLDDGSKSYLDALAAIKAFETAVRGICGAVCDKHKPQLVGKIGLEDAEWHDHDNPAPEDRFAELGVYQNSPSGRETLYVYVRWDGDQVGAPKILAEVSLEFSTRNDRNDYGKLLREVSSIRPGDDSDYPYLWSSKTLTNLSKCAEVLDELLNEWLACWPAGRRLQ
jgi:hypothetical protein